MILSSLRRRFHSLQLSAHSRTGRQSGRSCVHVISRRDREKNPQYVPLLQNDTRNDPRRRTIVPTSSCIKRRSGRIRQTTSFDYPWTRNLNFNSEIHKEDDRPCLQFNRTTSRHSLPPTSVAFPSSSGTWSTRDMVTDSIVATDLVFNGESNAYTHSSSISPLPPLPSNRTTYLCIYRETIRIRISSIKTREESGLEVEYTES